MTKQNKNWKGFGEISGRKWHSIKEKNVKQSKRKSRSNVPFEIDIQYAWELFLSQKRKCALSGQKLYFYTTKKDEAKTTASLDRIDNDKGYVEGNVQWVHKDVNRMKNVFDEKYFLKMCIMIAKEKMKCSQKSRTGGRSQQKRK